MSDRDLPRAGECAEAGKGKAERAFQRTEDNLQIKPAAYKDLLRNRDFLLLWSGQMVSAIGDWVIVSVLFTFVDQISGGKSYAISLMMLSKFLPAVLLGFLAGIFIDRFDRKSTLIICDLCRAGLVVLLPFAGHLALICVLVFIMETFTIIYGPAKDASIPDLVEQEQLINANSLNMLTLYASMAFGAAIAGSIIGLFAWLGRINPGFIGKHVDPNKAAFFIDSLTFFISAWLIYHIGFKRLSEEEKVKMSTSQVKRDFREGLQYLWSHSLTRVILILTLACFLGGGTIYVLTVGFVKYVLGGGSSTFLYILTTLLFGMMGGSILAGVFRGRLRKERVVGLAICGFGAGVMVFSVLSVVWLSFIMAFLGGVCMGYAIVGMITLLHETLDEDFRGRAFASIQVIMRGSIFFSIMVAGPLADLINSLGRKLGFDPISFWIFRAGGSFKGDIDGKVVNFQYLLNGPQIILFVGGIVILAAGMYGQRSFRHCFGWKRRDPILKRKADDLELQKDKDAESTPATPQPEGGGNDEGRVESSGKAKAAENGDAASGGVSTPQGDDVGGDGA